jgi:hypothetical protein
MNRSTQSPEVTCGFEDVPTTERSRYRDEPCYSRWGLLDEPRGPTCPANGLREAGSAGAIDGDYPARTDGHQANWSYYRLDPLSLLSPGLIRRRCVLWTRARHGCSRCLDLRPSVMCTTVSVARSPDDMKLVLRLDSTSLSPRPIDDNVPMKFGEDK